MVICVVKVFYLICYGYQFYLFLCVFGLFLVSENKNIKILNFEFWYNLCLGILDMVKIENFECLKICMFVLMGNIDLFLFMVIVLL